MVELQPVDAVEVTLVVDNFVDILLAGTELRLPPPSRADLEAEDLEGCRPAPTPAPSTSSRTPAA